MFVYKFLLLSLLERIFAQQTEYISKPLADLCSSGSIDSSARISLGNGKYKYFLSSGHNFWLLNVTDELPNENNVQHLPFEFKPDVALIKDTTGCSVDGRRTLLLIEMKHSWNGKEAEWNKIEGWIEGEDLNWSTMEKVAYCDLSSEICTTKDNYFTTMGFDWKRKLNSAFGVIGETAYLVQDKNVFKVHYKNRCIKNPYKDVVSFNPINLGTTTTGAMSFKNDDGNVTIILFDHDMYYNFTAESLEDVQFDEQISDGSLWKVNGQEFFNQCPKLDSVFAFLSFDFFGSSSKHFSQKPMMIFMISIFVLLIIMTVIIVGTTFAFMSHRGSPTGVYEINEEGLMSEEESKNDTKIDSNENGSKEKKTFLQTSC